MQTKRKSSLALLFALAISVTAVSSALAADIAPLQPLPAGKQASAGMVDLGKMLFFDARLSGDATISCATCHDPAKAFTDGLPLSKGYPGTLYFRNTPTLINAVSQDYFYWDARMSGDDLPSLVRDHIAEAHFFQADGRLLIERLRQVPEYEAKFKEVAGGEPSYGKILSALTAFVSSLRSQNTPVDKYLTGDEKAISESAVRGLELFRGKANCVRCHNGPMLTDGKLHATGVPENADVFKNPERHITFRRFMRTIGVGECATLRKDIGHACVTKNDADAGKFRTPSLREVGRTAPYMHNGTLATLEDVVAFYNAGGGESENKASSLKPLGLNEEQQKDLVKFLRQLSGNEIKMVPVESPKYQLRELGSF